jgi:hypothetical protein
MATTLSSTGDDREILGRAPVRELLDRLRDSVRVTDGGTVELQNEEALRAGGIDILAAAAGLSDDADVRASRAGAGR